MDFRAKLIVTLLTSVTGFCLLSTVACGEGDVASIQVIHDREAFVTTINVSARNGRVSWTDIFRGVSRARGFDDSALENLASRGAFSLDSPFTRPILAAMNAALSPDIRFRIKESATPGTPSQLQIRLDRRALLASHREITRRLRKTIIAKSKISRTYGLRLDRNWQRTPVDQPLILLVHGLQSSGRHMANLLVRPRAAGLPCAVFDYPNDQPIQDSALSLARELRDFRRTHPDRRVTILAHSMGGLVARAVVEDPRLDPGNVDRLIMISTPNQGSILAEFGFGLDLCESVIGVARRDRARWAAAAIEDGLANAQIDLQPGSPFLAALNARDRNPHISYSVFMGDVAHLKASELAAARRLLGKAGESCRWVQFFGSRVDVWLADLEEVIDGRGDGAVALKRGRLAGVEDTVVRHFSHLSFNQSPMTGEAELVLEDVMKRLER
jgi:pimeloyl-ACP methyl ester carboxylesterase